MVRANILSNLRVNFECFFLFWNLLIISQQQKTFLSTSNIILNYMRRLFLQLTHNLAVMTNTFINFYYILYLYTIIKMI